ncbi:cytoplasmic tRNA 2-thiolation protein 2-A-like isoform X2 [Ptychodera flava]|uniref:cytoplasmic tRNA 2-thiolation protein 2-A-like isoform X2 n=1 Tax=Ptychodera flava TaxID=63121 RepID=UPI00396A28CC
MCQVQEGGEEPEKARPSLRTTCMRCDQSAVVELKAYELVFCRQCFLNYFTHKFRSTIGKSKLVKKGEKGIREENHKKLRFHPGVIYMDEGAVTGQSSQEREAVCDQIQNALSECTFPCHVEALENAVDLDDKCLQPGENDGSCETVTRNMTKLRIEIDDSKTMQLQELLSSTKSVTAKEDIVQKLRNKLLLHIARTYKYDKVMLGNSGTNLSVCILSDLAKGRGAAVPLDTNFADYRHGDILFLRPMREFTSKEIAIYNRFHNIEPVVIPTLTTKAPVNASINHLTEAFVTNLQVNFPSTVNTVFRTGEKLCDAKSRSTDMENCCVLCQAPLDTSVGKASALKSTEFSLSLMKERTIDKKPTNQSEDAAGCQSNSATECCGQGDGSCHSNSHVTIITEQQLAEYLCYACRVTVRDMKDISRLPKYVTEEVTRRTNRSKLKAEIEDFLLEDSD